MQTANFFLTNISFSFIFICMITNDIPPYLLQYALIMTSGLLGEQHRLRDVWSCVGTRAGALCVMTSGEPQMLLLSVGSWDTLPLVSKATEYAIVYM